MKIRNIVLAIIIVLIDAMALACIAHTACDVTTEVIKLSITNLLLIIAVTPQPSLQKVESY